MCATLKCWKYKVRDMACPPYKSAFNDESNEVEIEGILASYKICSHDLEILIPEYPPAILINA